MITLHKFGPAFGLPDASPFVMKVETYLRMTGQPYETATGDVRKAPRGQLPFVDVDGKRIADSSEIVAYLESKRPERLDAHLTPREAATMRAVQSMLEEHLYFGVLFLRWATDDGWRVFEPRLREMMGAMGVPSLMLGMIAKRARKYTVERARTQGLGRRPRGEVVATSIALVDAFAELLGDGPYVAGAKPTTYDASAYAFAAGVLCPAFDNELQKHAAGKANLVGYADRMKAAYFSA